MKSDSIPEGIVRDASHPSRGAWIEISAMECPSIPSMGRTPHGVRGLKYLDAVPTDEASASHPSRGAWIEMLSELFDTIMSRVAPLTGCVD